MPDHGGVGVDQFRVDAEIVVVDNNRDAMPDLPAAALHRHLDVVDILGVPDAHALEIEEQRVAAGIVADPAVEIEVERVWLRPMAAGPEDARVHQVGRAHDRLERHVRQDVALDVDAGRDLDQLDAVRRRGGTRSAR